MKVSIRLSMIYMALYTCLYVAKTKIENFQNYFLLCEKMKKRFFVGFLVFIGLELELEKKKFNQI